MPGLLCPWSLRLSVAAANVKTPAPGWLVVLGARLVALSFVALAFAGCVDPGEGGVPAALVGGDDASSAAAFDGLGAPVALPQDARGAMRFAAMSLEHEGAEPTLGVDAEGRIFVISDTAVLRSSDQGATWEDVSPLLNWPAGSLDPYLHVDVDTGRVFVDHLYLGCSYLLHSDDQGASWVANPAACGRPANDHQTIGTGKPRGVSTVGYPNVVYYAYNDFVSPVGVGAVDVPSFTSVARSLDGGLTFQPATLAIGPEDCGGLNGHLVTAPDGTVYVPAAGCDEPVVAVSRDSGLTWTTRTIDTGGAGRSAPGDDPSLAVDSEGNAYLVWPGLDARMYGSVSSDGGETWSSAFRVSPPDVTSSLMPTSVAGSAGRVAFAYYGTKSPTDGWESVNSGDATDEARWHVFVTYSLDALAGPAATLVTVQATPDEDPIQIGSIHNGGGGSADRNLLDFFDMARDAHGRVSVAFTDGCTRECASPDTSRSSTTSFALLVEGPSLLAGKGRLAAPEGHAEH